MFQFFQDFRPDIVRTLLAHLVLVVEVGVAVAVRLCASVRAGMAILGLRVSVRAIAVANDRRVMVAAPTLVARWDLDKKGRLRCRWFAAAIPSPGAAAPRPCLYSEAA